jgi:DNA-binding transcriptional ArsR family regulator
MARIDKQEVVFKALADGKRREILDLLKVKPRTTGELCDHFKGIDRCTVMLHLGVLERADLVIVKRDGRLRWNYLNVLPIKEVYDRWIGEYASKSVELLSKLKKDLEG